MPGIRYDCKWTKKATIRKILHGILKSSAMTIMIISKDSKGERKMRKVEIPTGDFAAESCYY